MREQRTAYAGGAVVVAALVVAAVLLPGHVDRHVRGLLVVVAFVLAAGVGSALARVALRAARRGPVR